jgi:hypothetical protein
VTDARTSTAPAFRAPFGPPLLWLRAARAAGARPSIAKASRLGALSVPLAMAAALGALALTGSR